MFSGTFFQKGKTGTTNFLREYCNFTNFCHRSVDDRGDHLGGPAQFLPRAPPELGQQRQRLPRHCHGRDPGSPDGLVQEGWRADPSQLEVCELISISFRCLSKRLVKRLNVGLINILWTIASGRRLHSQQQEFQSVYECIDKITQFMSKAAIMSFMPFLARILPERVTKMERGRYYRDRFVAISEVSLS